MFARLHLRRSTIIALLVALAMIATMSTAFAKGGPPAGRGGGVGSGHGGGPPTTELSNNLSVPTIMVGGGGFTGVTCGTADAPSTLVPPSGDPKTGYEIDPLAYYYVQGINKWQAQCYAATTASATAAWGDNLTGDANLSTGSPIRVELGLMNSDSAVPSMDGYTVVKLEPSALDRESAYGTLATQAADGTFSATATTFAYGDQRVYDSKVTFSIQNVATGAYVVPMGTTATAEINATGNVVYGYNLRVQTAGDYLITYNVPTASVTGTDAGTVGADAHSVSLVITVTGGTGGGGRP